MAKPKKTWKDLLNSMAGKGKNKNGEAKIGKYTESTGGGTPMKKGEKIDYHAKTAKEAQAYRAQHPDEVVRVDQPRDKDGQFTYNSVNAKPLEYGPSRGKTVPPFLEGFDITFAKKSGKGALVDLDGKKYTLPDKFKTKEDFLKACREYKEKEGIEGFNGNFGDVAKGKGGKTGKVTKIERGVFMQNAKNKKASINKVNSINTVFGKTEKNEMNTDTKTSTDMNTTNTDATEKQTSSVDYSLAKSDPKKFVSDNFDEIQSILDIAEKNDYEIDVDDMVQSIADGKVSSFDQIKKMLSEG